MNWAQAAPYAILGLALAVPGWRRLRATETILHEVDEYTTAEVGLLTPAERRAVLYESTAREATGLDDPALTYAGAPRSAPPWWIREHEQGDL